MKDEVLVGEGKKGMGEYHPEVAQIVEEGTEFIVRGQESSLPENMNVTQKKFVKVTKHSDTIDYIVKNINPSFLKAGVNHKDLPTGGCQYESAEKIGEWTANIKTLEELIKLIGKKATITTNTRMVREHGDEEQVPVIEICEE